MTEPAALLLTHSRDVFTIDRVMDALGRRGVRPVRLDTDLFPTELRLSLEDLGDGPIQVLRRGEDPVRGDEITAVWTRSIWPPRLPEDLDPRFGEGCVAQSRDMLAGFLANLRPQRWLSHPESVRRSANKLVQHRAASKVDLPVPRTLITNDQDRVRRFCDTIGGPVVTKLLKPLSMAMGRAPMAVYTSELGPDDLEALDGLELAPMIFQEKVDKDLELRVMYVCGRLFAGAVDASGSQRGETDWRLSETGETAWQPAEVPAETAGKMRRLMAELDLETGAFDLIRTPAGAHVFLEVNPLGEWGMLERDLGLPISETLAAALAGELDRDGDAP